MHCLRSRCSACQAVPAILALPCRATAQGLRLAALRSVPSRINWPRYCSSDMVLIARVTKSLQNFQQQTGVGQGHSGFREYRCVLSTNSDRSHVQGTAYRR